MQLFQAGEVVENRDETRRGVDPILLSETLAFLDMKFGNDFGNVWRSLHYGVEVITGMWSSGISLNG
jgi:hypothetical protein